jgi:hypothetical protein
VSGEVAFGCAISDSCTCHGKARQHGSIVAAGRSGSGKILVDLSPFYGPPGLLVARMGVLWAKHDPVAVVVNPKSHSGTLIRPLFEAGIIALQPTAQDVAEAHGSFLDLVDDGGLEHLDQDALTAAVRAAQQRPLSGAQAWDPRVETDQGPLVSATLATWAFTNWERLSSPGVWAV